MLTNLSINNYTLIDKMNVNFTTGLTTITGETGAGKSILLGGLGLVLGNRAEANTLLDPSKKCIIEAEFSIENFNLKSFFEEEDIDYDVNTIIRRELLPSGKSRAFVNDTPVKLEVLTKLKKYLIDVHSQHQTLQISNQNYQFSILDSRANNLTLLSKYALVYKQWLHLEKELETFKTRLQEESNQHEYNTFLFDELNDASFKGNEQEELENELELLNNVELIQENLSQTLQLLSDEENGVLSQLNTIKSALNKIQSFDGKYKDLYDRILSVSIETDDIVNEVDTLSEAVLLNPNRLEFVNNRLQLLYNLYKKHNVATISDLHDISTELEKKVNRIDNYDSIIAEKEKELEITYNKARELATKLSANRVKTAPTLALELTKILQYLGMPNANFKVAITEGESLSSNGINEMKFLFSANKGGQLGELKQVASGGELSRIMLAVKSVMAKYTHLPTMVFDEIDTGLSGEVALKMAKIMKEMAKNMQVISITHLPQIAASGDQQMKVYKTQVQNITQSNIKLLQQEDRLLEIAEMLGGKNLSETAINHAKQLLS